MSALKTGLAALALLCAALGIAVVLLWTRVNRLETIAATPSPPAAHTPPPSARDRSPDVEPDLAPRMEHLQTLTQKLYLSVAASNDELAEFYLHESFEAASEIQDEVPEYHGHPIALLIDRYLKPAYSELQNELKRGHDAVQLRARFSGIVAACNSCHGATQHPFIRIPDARSSNNPFLQNFAPGRPDGAGDSP